MKRLLTLLLLLAAAPAAEAQGRVKAARELAELLVAKFGSKAGTVGRLTTRIETLAAKHGDDAVLAFRKASPAGIEMVEQAGANGGKALRALATHGVQAEARVLARPVAWKQFLQHGDEAAVALCKHPGVAEPLIEKGGANAVKALAAVEAQSGRRLAMLSEGELARHPEMFGVAAKHGPERVTSFLWAHRKELAVGTAAAAFIADPEPFLDGTSKLVTAGGDAVVKPVVQEASHLVSTLVWSLLAGGLAVGGVVTYLAVKHPEKLAAAGKLAVGVASAARKP